MVSFEMRVGVRWQTARLLSLFRKREGSAGLSLRRTLRIAARANLLVVGLASFGFARPVVSILLTHGTTVAAAMLNARATTGRTL